MTINIFFGKMIVAKFYIIRIRELKYVHLLTNPQCIVHISTIGWISLVHNNMIIYVTKDLISIVIKDVNVIVTLYVNNSRLAENGLR